jgi:hypothetical protein
MLQEETEVANLDKTIETALFVNDTALIARATTDGVVNDTTLNTNTRESSHKV